MYSTTGLRLFIRSQRKPIDSSLSLEELHRANGWNDALELVGRVLEDASVEDREREVIIRAVSGLSVPVHKIGGTRALVIPPEAAEEIASAIAAQSLVDSLLGRQKERS